MLKNVVIAVGVGVVAVIGAAIVFFDTDNNYKQLDQLSGPDSGEEEDNQGPDSGEEEDNQGPDSGEEEDNQGPDSGEEISLEEDLKNRAKGSCNVISEGSTCVEYIGSYWTA